MIFAEVIHSTPDGRDVVLGEEVGYGLRFYTCVSTIPQHLKTGLKVWFTGIGSDDDFQLASVTPADFEQCQTCLRPAGLIPILYGNVCVKHDPPTTNTTRRIKGVWRVVYKRKDQQQLRFWVSKGNHTFAYSIPKSSPFARRARGVVTGDYVRLKGWLDEKASLKYFKRCQKKRSI